MQATKDVQLLATQLEWHVTLPQECAQSFSPGSDACSAQYLGPVPGIARFQAYRTGAARNRCCTVLLYGCKRMREYDHRLDNSGRLLRTSAAGKGVL